MTINNGRVMNDVISANQNEQDVILADEVSDEVLEAAGSAAVFTLAACSGLSACPA